MKAFDLYHRHAVTISVTSAHRSRDFNLAFCRGPFRKQRRWQVAGNHDQSPLPGKCFKQGKYRTGCLMCALHKPDVIDEQGVKPHQGCTKGAIGSLFDRVHHFLDKIKYATIQYIETFLHRKVTGRRLHQSCLSRPGRPIKNDDPGSGEIFRGLVQFIFIREK